MFTAHQKPLVIEALNNEILTQNEMLSDTKIEKEVFDSIKADIFELNEALRKVQELP